MKLPRLNAARGWLPRDRFLIAALFVLVAVPAAPAMAARQADKGGSTQSKPRLSGPESLAYAVPRSEPLNGEEVVLPRPLTPSDVTLYRRIFAEQRDGKVAVAAKLMPGLDSRLLIGQVLAQLYLGPHHHSKPAELEAWLVHYSGQPGSDEIYRLLRERDPPAARRVPDPKLSYLPEPPLTSSGAAPPPPPAPAIPAGLPAEIGNLDHDGDTRRAIAVIADTRGLSTDQGAWLRAEVARALFAAGHYAEAYTIAAGAERECQGKVWAPSYIAGLASWQRGRIAIALHEFAEAAGTAQASPGERAAGAFWAARASLRLARPNAYLRWLGRAAASKDSFYGMLAGRLLGQGQNVQESKPTLAEADIESIDALPDGRLAFALLQLGRLDAAGRAFRALWPEIDGNLPLEHAVLRIAARAGLVDVAVALRQVMPASGGALAEVSLPMPALHPLGGFSVDPSLVYALARTESGFDSRAVSAAGARGLMQLMPETAAAMARRRGIVADLTNPAANLALGQAYLRYLGGPEGASRDLLAILASYNAGPVAADAWVASIHDHGDPLIFLESIPGDATRRFIRQVLTDSWIYAETLGTVPSSLSAIAAGNFPQLQPYKPLALADRN